MRSERTPLSNGLLFGLITGVFGGALWTLIVSVVPDEALIASRWIVVSGGFLIWFFVGFLVGAFNVPRIANETEPQRREEHSLVQRMLDAVGWLLYRLIVGWCVGVIATPLFSFVGTGIWFLIVRFLVDLRKVPSDSPLLAALAGGMMIGTFCSFLGSIFGALMVTRRSPSHRPAIGLQALRSSFLSLLLGIPFGAALRLPPDEESHLVVYFLVSVPIGVLAGILGGLWTAIGKMRKIEGSDGY